MKIILVILIILILIGILSYLKKTNTLETFTGTGGFDGTFTIIKGEEIKNLGTKITKLYFSNATESTDTGNIDARVENIIKIFKELTHIHIKIKIKTVFI